MKKKYKEYEKFWEINSFNSYVDSYIESVINSYGVNGELYNYILSKHFQKRKINVFLGITRKKNGSTRRSKT